MRLSLILKQYPWLVLGGVFVLLAVMSAALAAIGGDSAESPEAKTTNQPVAVSESDPDSISKSTDQDVPPAADAESEDQSDDATDPDGEDQPADPEDQQPDPDTDPNESPAPAATNSPPTPQPPVPDPIVTPTPAPAASQITVWSQTVTHDYNSYAQFSNFVTSDLSAYTGGFAYLRVVVTNKSTDEPMILQPCFWRHENGVKFSGETCSHGSSAVSSNKHVSSPGTVITSPGEYFVRYNAPGDWWYKGKSSGGAPYDWTIPSSLTRILLKDPDNPSKVMNSKNCGSACWPGGTQEELQTHVPITMVGELIFTKTSASFAKPAAWANCPSSVCG